MKIKNVFQVSVVIIMFALAAIANGNDKRVLYVEVRSPKEIQYDASAHLEFTTDTTAEGTPLSYTKQKEVGDFRVFQQSYHLLARERRRAIIVHTRGGRNQQEQVFLLSSPQKPEPLDWTDWKHPNYTETNASWNFIRGYKGDDRSTNIPPESVEVRYKIE